MQSGPALSVEKLADRSEAEVGDWINYTIQVNNTGNVTLTGVRAEDNLTGAVWTVGTLSPGQNYTNTTRYQLMLSDLPGPLTNQLLVNGTDPCGTEVNASALETVQIPPSCTGVPKVLTVCASGCNYTSIQAAIDAACPGDTILVNSGTYFEHVNVNKALTLQGVGAPVVDVGGFGSAITISADGCTLQGFVAIGSGAYPEAGVKATSSSNTITGNTATGNSDIGIYLTSSSNNTLSGNTATGNFGVGIGLVSSSNNTISGNTATGNSYGIGLDFSSNSNTISGNTVTGNICGIGLVSSSGNTISGNTATGNSILGIYLDSSSSNSIIGNTVTGNSYGIGLVSSSGNTITGNTVIGSSIYSIYLDSSSGNNIYLNTLDNARSNGANHWNATTTQSYEHNGRILTGLLGNIWSDYDGFDCDGDGMGDTPYDKIEAGSDKDYHPIGGEESSPALSVEKLADRSEAQVGDWINYIIQVNNTGNVTLTGVEARDNLTGAVWKVGTLAPGQNYTNTTRYQVKMSDLPGPRTNELKANGTCSCGQVNDSAIETVALRYNPQIQVNKTANLTGGAPSTILGFKIDVSNSGNANFTSVEVEDLLPQGLDYLSDDSGLAHSQTGNSYTWNLGRLNSNESASFNITAHINGEEVGELINAVNATGYPEYGDSVNSSASAAVQAEEAKISVTKTASPSFGPPGANVTFAVRVDNTGSASLPHVFVSDLLPMGMSYVSSSDSGSVNGRYVNWSNIGPLTAGGSKSLQLVAQIDGPVTGMVTLTNLVDVQAKPEHGENVTASASASIQAEEASITVTKSADPSSA